MQWIEQEVTCLVLLDLSAAIDTVDHMIFYLTDSTTDMDMNGTILNWISGYLESRTQQVLIRDSTFSKTIHIPIWCV